VKPHPITPAPGQKSVWDYPRPPCVQDSQKHIQVIFNGVIIAETRRARRVLETGSPPVYYVPPSDIRLEGLVLSAHTTWCEWKGRAVYYTVVVDRKAPNAAWFYPDPTPPFTTIKDYVAFYPRLIDACYVDGERVQPQPGTYYGGWITKDIVGPFKGGPGTSTW